MLALKVSRPSTMVRFFIATRLCINLGADSRYLGHVEEVLKLVRLVDE